MAKAARPARKAASPKPARASRRVQSKPAKVPAAANGEVPTAPPAPAAAKAQVKITAAKGRPMLTWVGKHPLSHLPAFPAQLVERFESAPVPDPAAWKDWPARYPRGGLLFHGDNKEVLAHLLANGFRGKVQLIYIDPPFDSGADYVRRITLRGRSSSAKMEGEEYALGEQIQYTDIWANDSYLQFMYERLLLIKELMSPSASIFLHADTKRNYLLRALMDEVFGSDRFVNEVVWRRADAHNDPGKFGAIHDTIYYYGPAERQWNSPHIDLVSAKLETDAHYVWDAERNMYFRLGDLRGPGDRGPRYVFKGVDRHWKWSKEKLEEADRAGQIYFTKNGIPFYRLYIENEQIPLQDLWMDVPQIKSGAEKEEYPTQKPESLIERIVLASSDPADLILDCFIGSGTTAAVAQELGRRWIGCDINKGAIQTTAKRLQRVIEEQAAAAKAPKTMQGSLIETNSDEANAPAPAQFGFTTWRVNDYDLQIQHNEAVNLACEHLGVQRTRGDRFFDGTLGKSLVKIVSFDHPLSPLDIEDLKRELDSRKDEDRHVTFVCLGIELAAQASVDDWNRLRKSKDSPNHLHVIELRRDAKHGGWLNHMPAEASVGITRKGKSIVVAIKDFISPSIVERLKQQAGVLEPKIDDCRAMIDSIAIDTAYDGAVFNVTMVDVPERKTDFVEGRYELPAPKGETTVAVRITDMLGEEVLVTKVV
jgi:DNA modification methylase